MVDAKSTKMKHGASRYRQGLCKDGADGRACDVCKAGNADLQRAGSERRAARLRADPSLRPHGDVNTYMNWLCRCTPCSDVWKEKMSDYWHTRRKHDAKA